MALEKVADILKSAQEHNTAVFSINCIDYNTISGVITAAEAAKTPVLVQLYPGHTYDYHTIDFEGFAAIVIDLAAKVRTPIGLHLDHCYSLDQLNRAADAGFSSVMYDASTYPLEENIRLSKEVVAAMHKRGVIVEGEIGHVGLAAEGADSSEDLYTKPDAAKQYFEETGADSLAIAIGNAHGFYKGTPHLDIQRLDEIHAAAPSLPLVLHGGSGIPDDQLEVAFSRGITKFNYGTNYLWTYYKAMEDFMKAHADQEYTDVLDMAIPIQKKLADFAQERLHLSKF